MKNSEKNHFENEVIILFDIHRINSWVDQHQRGTNIFNRLLQQVQTRAQEIETW